MHAYRRLTIKYQK